MGGTGKRSRYDPILPILPILTILPYPKVRRAVDPHKSRRHCPGRAAGQKMLCPIRMRNRRDTQGLTLARILHSLPQANISDQHRHVRGFKSWAGFEPATFGL
jgi:hypothetical protein